MKGKTETCFLTPISSCIEDEEKNAENAENNRRFSTEIKNQFSINLKL